MVKPKYMQMDFETFSAVDIFACGGYRYIDDDSFEPLLLAVAFDDEEPFIVDLATGEKVPERVWAAIYDPEITKIAWNAQFERTIFGKMAGERLSPDSWKCTMVWCASLSLPLMLKTAQVLKTGEQKDAAGEALIRYFCIPCKPTEANGGRTRNLPEHNPEGWEQFREYCKQDVRTEREIRKRLESYPLPEREWEFYHLDQRINDRGVRIDMKLVEQAITCDLIQSEIMTKKAYELTGLENPNSISQLKGWLEDRGIAIESLGKKDVESLIESLERYLTDTQAMEWNSQESMPETRKEARETRKEARAHRGAELSRTAHAMDGSFSHSSEMRKDNRPQVSRPQVSRNVLEMMKLRLQMAKSSVKKYQAAQRYVCRDGRAYGLFQFAGANRTQRWSGRGIQLQNLPQNHIETLEEARELIRMGCFDTAESLYGNTPEILSQLIRTMLIPRDGCEFLIADFSAIEARVLAWLAGEEWVLQAFREGKDLYCATASQMFGVPVVKHGINGELRSKGKIATLACGYGGSTGALVSMGALSMGLKESELPGLIESWRAANPKIVQFWRDIEKAAMETIQDHRERRVGRTRFLYGGNTLWIVLPSGRRLAYIKPRLQPNRFGRIGITYEGLGPNHAWGRGETYSGKLAENITQATARDLLAEAMRRLELAGLDIVAHVHDEVILEAPRGSVTVEAVCRIMNQNPEWAEGLPIESDGYIGERFYYKS